MGPYATRFAVTTWQGRVAPVFDVCRRLLVVDVSDGAVVASAYHAIEAQSPVGRAGEVVGLCGSMLVCGAISEPIAQYIQGRAVRLHPFVAGPVDEVVLACINGELPNPKYTMPGCAPGPHRRSLPRGYGH